MRVGEESAGNYPDTLIERVFGDAKERWDVLSPPLLSLERHLTLHFRLMSPCNLFRFVILVLL